MAPWKEHWTWSQMCLSLALLLSRPSGLSFLIYDMGTITPLGPLQRLGIKLEARGLINC